MRRFFRFGLGVLELAAAVLLVGIGLRLPREEAVRGLFDKVGKVAGDTEVQVAALNKDIGQLHAPEVQKLFAQLQPHLDRIRQERQQSKEFNFDAVREANRSLGSLAQGLEAWAGALNPDTLSQLSDSVSRLASFLDERVAPAAAVAATRLEKTTEALRKDAMALSQILKDAPPDLKAVREIHDSLGRFNEGLDRVSFLINPDSIKSLKDGFGGMEESLDTGADQVARLASYSYPVVKFNGLRPQVTEKQFWPEGETIADGMRKGAKALKAADKELAKVVQGLPHMQRSLEESKKAVTRTRDMLGQALKNQDRLEAVLKSIPQNTARLAEELPALSADLARVLRDAEKLGEVAAALRQAHKGMDAAVKSWPGVRDNLLVSAEKMKKLQQRVDQALGNSDSYREAFDKSLQLADDLARTAPMLTAHLGQRLDNQQKSLENLGGNLVRLQESLPETADSVSEMLQMVRWLLWALAAMAALHAISVLLTPTPRPEAQA